MCIPVAPSRARAAALPPCGLLAALGLLAVASVAGVLGAQEPGPPAPGAAPSSTPGLAVDSGRVLGRVTAGTTGQPVAGAVVRLLGIADSAVTGADGRFRLPNVPAGRHTVVVRAIGYTRAERAVAVPAGGDAPLDVVLTAAARTLTQVVVTGTRAAQEIGKIPAALSVVSAADVQQARQTTTTSRSAASPASPCACRPAAAPARR